MRGRKPKPTGEKIPRANTLPELIAAACALSAAACGVGWLKARVRLAAFRREHEELTHSSQVIEFEKHLLELVARGMPLNELFDNIARAIEAMATECICTAMLLDEERRRILLCVSGPSLPAGCQQALSDLEIGPDVGACGSAAFRNQTVIVEDIATDHRFARSKDFIMGFGLRSCWSVPIRNPDGIVQGTFAMYHRKPATPTPAELRLVEAGALLAGTVVERLRSEQRLRETAERLDLAEKAAAFGIWEVAIATGVVSFSQGFATQLGLPAASRQLGLREVETLLHRDDRAAVWAAAARAVKAGTFRAEFRIVRPDGSVRWERAQGRVELVDGVAKRATGALIDISPEKDLMLRLDEARTAAESSASAAHEAERLELDRKNVLELVAKDQPLDQIALAIAGAVVRHLPRCSCSIQMEVQGAGRISVSTLVPKSIARILDRIPVAAVRETLSAAPVAELSGDPEWQQYVADPSGVAKQNYLAAPIVQNRLVAGAIITLLPGERFPAAADGALLESWARFASLAIERRGLYEQLTFRAQYDELTMLLNRASLYDRLDAMTRAIHEGGALAVLYFDLDSFKEINDQYGHAAGDAVLRIVSRRVLQRIRNTDVAARVGGDEFVILLPGVRDRKEARRVAELVGQAVHEPIVFAGTELRVRASTGIALYPDDGQHTDALLKIADENMYRAKLSRPSQSLRRISHKARVLEHKPATDTAAHLPVLVPPSLEP